MWQNGKTTVFKVLSYFMQITEMSHRKKNTPVCEKKTLQFAWTPYLRMLAKKHLCVTFAKLRWRAV